MAVLNCIRNADEILCSGDIIGYFSNPNEVCDILRATGVRCIRGNHEAYILGLLETTGQVKELARLEWTRMTLNRENSAWIEGLPNEIHRHFGRRRVTVRHASPWDESTYVYDNSPSFERIVLNEDEILVLGHTHRAFMKPAGKGFVINPGSVGQSRDCESGASLVLFDTETGCARFDKVVYDVKSYQRNLVDAGWDSRVVASLNRKRETAVEGESK